MIDKIKGMILGHALGDVLGGPVEFPPFPHYNGNVQNPIQRYTRNYGIQKSSVGQITDDTEMTIALIQAIGKGYTKENAILEYMNWANNKYDLSIPGNSPFMGENTRKLFIIGKKSKPSMKLYNSRFQKRFINDKEKENAKSNGALMRAYPLVFCTCKEIIEDVFITNPSKFVLHIVELYILAIRLALQGENKEKIKKLVYRKIKYDDIKIAFENACTNTFRNVTIKRGYILHAFYCAFWGLFNFNDYKTAIDAIITLGHTEGEKAKIAIPGKWKKNEIILGDTDTNAAITGALLGAYYGLKSMCSDEITKNNIDTMLDCDPNKGDIKRPTRYIMNTYNFKLFVDILYKQSKSLTKSNNSNINKQ